MNFKPLYIKLFFFYLIVFVFLWVTPYIFTSCNKKKEQYSQRELKEQISTNRRSINNYISNSESDTISTRSFDSYIRKFLRKSDLNGASFALMKDGKLVYAKGYGMADIENNIPMESYHLLRVASISKLFTAVGIMRLIEDGKLSFDSKVFGKSGILNDSIFLHINDKRIKEITVLHLLKHQGGFSRPFGDACFHVDIVANRIDKELPLTLDDMVVYASQNKLRALPGTRYRYSNLGYVVLSKVIEKATGMNYETFMKESVFAPASCFDMHLTENYKENRTQNEVSYYEVKEAETCPAADGSGVMVYKSNGGNDVKLLSGAGAWCGSPAEILRFVSSIDNNTYAKNILSDEFLALMTEKQNPIGWSRTSEEVWQRSGSMAGTNAFLKREQNGYTWIFITNTSNWLGYKFNRTINKEISEYIKRVKDWSEHDLFELISNR